MPKKVWDRLESIKFDLSLWKPTLTQLIDSKYMFKAGFITVNFDDDTNTIFIRGKINKT